MAGERAKDNKTLTAPCASCGKETPADIMVGLAAGQGRNRKVHAVCRPCYEKGWRPEGYGSR